MATASAARTVYVVDPDESVRQGLSRLVASAGLRCRGCESVAVFLRDAPGDSPACALLEVSGLWTCDPAVWSGLRAVAAAMPVIALSARDDAATQRIARALGAQAFFRKPVDAAALLDSIEWVTRAEAGGGGTDRSSLRRSRFPR